MPNIRKRAFEPSRPGYEPVPKFVADLPRAIGFILAPIPKTDGSSRPAKDPEAVPSSGLSSIGVTLHSKGGFTVIELMVVIAIMMVMTGLFTVNLAGQRVNRNMKIAQNELVSNLRKIQSYSLSGRSEGINQPIQYYILKFDSSAGKSDGYTIQAMYQNALNNNQWTIVETEKINFPKGIFLASSSPGSFPITINRPTFSPDQTPMCALVVFKLPYGKVFFSPESSGTCNQSDYDNITTFKVNSSTGNPVSEDSVLTLTLVDSTKTLSKTVKINGVTGLISTQ